MTVFTRSGGLVLFLPVALAGLVLGIAAAQQQPLFLPGAVTAAILLILALSFLIPLHLAYFAMIVVALVEAIRSPTLLQIATADLTFFDLSYLILLLRTFRERDLVHYVRYALGTVVGKLALAVFLVFGLSAIYAALLRPEAFSLPVASYLRYVQSASLGLLLPLALSSDRARLLGWVRLLASLFFAIIWSTTFYSSAPGISFQLNPHLFSTRSSSFVEINVMGLYSALLILIVCAQWGTGRIFSRPLSAVFLLTGIAGLLMTRSQGAHLAVAVGLMTLLLLAPRRSSTVSGRALLLMIAVPVILATAWISVETLRPESITRGLSQTGGSIGHRLLSARIALEALKSHPVYGTGWQTNVYLFETDPDILRRSLSSEQIGAIAPELLPLSTGNVYSQILAETGIVGFTIFTGFLLTLAVSFIRLARRTRQYLPLLGALWTIGMGFWLNGTGLFGGGAEQVLFWSAAGLYFACASASSAPLLVAKRRPVFQRQPHAQAHL